MCDKPTKGRAARHVPIHPNLRPLLEVMSEQCSGSGYVVPNMPGKANMSTDLREHLMVAGVARADLYELTATTKHITFHDTKATACTWAAVAGVPPLTIMQRAAHRSVDTTMLYVRLAEERTEGRFGEPFPELPACLTAANARAPETKRTHQTHTGTQAHEIVQSGWVASPGVEPGRITAHPVRASLPGTFSAVPATPGTSARQHGTAKFSASRRNDASQAHGNSESFATKASRSPELWCIPNPKSMLPK